MKVTKFHTMIGRTIKNVFVRSSVNFEEIFEEEDSKFLSNYTYFASDDQDAIYFELDNDTLVIFKHNRECCEEVNIKDIVGNLHDLIGEPLLEAEVVVNENEGTCSERQQSTFFKFTTSKANVNITWFGTDNGYYSTTVSMRQVERSEVNQSSLFSYQIDFDSRDLESSHHFTYTLNTNHIPFYNKQSDAPLTVVDISAIENATNKNSNKIIAHRQYEFVKPILTSNQEKVGEVTHFECLINELEIKKGFFMKFITGLRFSGSIETNFNEDGGHKPRLGIELVINSGTTKESVVVDGNVGVREVTVITDILGFIAK